MALLEDMGVKLLIDDFGTGYASLSNLQRYNFSAIKIDNSYIKNVLVSEQDRKLVTAIIAMARSMGVSVISEGVESKAQLDFLLKKECEYIQGNYFSGPVQSDAFLTEKPSITKVKVKGRSQSGIDGFIDYCRERFPKVTDFEVCATDEEACRDAACARKLYFWRISPSAQTQPRR